MKTMKFFALSLLAIASSASAKINFTAGVLRNETLLSGQVVMLELEQRKLCYQDETAYIEVELLEETADQVLLQFTVATKNETGAFMVRGLPKLVVPLVADIKTNTGTLRCDGPAESFTVVATVEKVEKAVVQAAE